MSDNDMGLIDLAEQAAGKFAEVGTSGQEAYFGLLMEAYHADLYWPSCYDLYNRLRRAKDVFNGFAFSGAASLLFVLVFLCALSVLSGE